VEPVVLSVVVPVYNVRAFLQDCLDSVLSQAGPDVEVIAVDDRSTDGSADILRSLEHPRLRTVFLPENVGLGFARNAGMDEAQGEYIAFLDSDDLLEPGALDAIRDRIVELDHPDVLLYDYARLFWDGRTQRNIKAELVAEAAARGRFTIEQFPELLDNFNSAWNKAYRRAWLDEVGLRFHQGYYEDISWTMRAMLQAGSIGGLDQVCLLYRQRVSGSILKTRSDKHLDALKQWAWVYSENDVVSFSPEVQAGIYHYMTGQLRYIYEANGRLPESSKRGFYTDMGRMMREHKPAEVRSTTAKRTLKRVVTSRDLYGVDRAIDRARRVPGKARSTARTAKKYARSAMNPDSREALRQRVRYRSARKAPVDKNLVLFSAYWHRSVSCNPGAIYEELRRTRPDLRLVWALDPSFGFVPPPGVETVVARSERYWELMAVAGTLVNNVNFETTFVKRPGQRMVQTQHGTPLKTMGIDLRHFPEAATMFTGFGGLLKRIATWDYLISSNRYSSIIWERCMPGHYKTVETGYPRNDVLVNGDPERAARTRAELGIAPDANVILYAPTMRDFQDEFASVWDLDRAAEKLSDDDVLLVRGHYLTSQEGRVDRGGRVIDVREYPSIESLCLAADVLVTDYSSVMFDFANTGKPIVIFAPDWEEYRRVRGAYFDLSQEHPGYFVEDEDELVQLLWDRPALQAMTQDDAYQAFRARFCEFDDGKAAQRVVELLFPR